MNREANMALFLSKAAESLEAGQELLDNKHFGFCASRAYYAMFYCAKAVLLHRKLQFAKHSAVMATFNREFVKSGCLHTRDVQILPEGVGPAQPRRLQPYTSG